MHNAGFIFLSTSRIYPIKQLEKLNYREDISRFELEETQAVTGCGKSGIAETFPFFYLHNVNLSTVHLYPLSVVFPAV